VIFPIKIKDMPIHTTVAILVFDIDEKEDGKPKFLGASTLCVYDDHKNLRQDKMVLRLWDRVGLEEKIGDGGRMRGRMGVFGGV
jgi:hypothetical protein